MQGVPLYAHSMIYTALCGKSVVSIINMDNIMRDKKFVTLIVNRDAARCFLQFAAGESESIRKIRMQLYIKI